MSIKNQIDGFKIDKVFCEYENCVHMLVYEL